MKKVVDVIDVIVLSWPVFLDEAVILLIFD